MDRYDEALAKARSGKSLEEIFPEMNESEDERDERIRKAIVHLLTVASESYLIDATGFKKEQFLSYLEKQKEQKEIPLMNGDADLYFDNWIQHNDTTKRGYFEEGIRYAQRLQKEQKLNLTAKGKGVYKICPHCKSRMIRDDSKVYTSMPPQYGYNCPKCGTMEFDTVMYDNPEMEEQIIDSKPLYTIEQVDEKIREAQQWKPSEEQMNALNALNCHGDLSYVGQQKQLIFFI
ncbi:MAG: hypothetical protein J5382_10080 [Bacteroidales bacterium]|nr:hypothetical protein [Bacteroidales bacterium]